MLTIAELHKLREADKIVFLRAFLSLLAFGMFVSKRIIFLFVLMLRQVYIFKKVPWIR